MLNPNAPVWTPKFKMAAPSTAAPPPNDGKLQQNQIQNQPNIPPVPVPVQPQPPMTVQTAPAIPSQTQIPPKQQNQQVNQNKNQNKNQNNNQQQNKNQKQNQNQNKQQPKQQNNDALTNQKLNQLKYQQKNQQKNTTENKSDNNTNNNNNNNNNTDKNKPSTTEELFFDNGGSIDGIESTDIKFDPTKTFSTKDHFNIVFIGHVDAGKSTLCGNILVLMGMVDVHTIEKYKQEAKNNNRESWYLAYVMDTNDEEKAKGKTVEVGRAYFETSNKRFTLLDCPGHKSYVPDMISGASQADIGVLVISARKGEFEAGFDRSGQTSEHALLIRTLGVSHVIVVVNKMDEDTVGWEKSRFDIIYKKLNDFLLSLGFKTITFIPISAKNGDNVKSKSNDSRATWYEGPTLVDYLDSISPLDRDITGPLRFPILEAYNEAAFWIGGKIESGFATINKKAVIMPGRQIVEICEIQINDKPVDQASVGENVMIKLKSGNENNIKKGMVLSYPNSICPVTFKIKAHLRILEIPNILSAGFPAVCHIHTTSQDCIISELLESTDLTLKKKVKNPPFTKSNSKIVCIIQLSSSVALESNEKVPSLAKISLRDQGTTIAIGYVIELLH